MGDSLTAGRGAELGGVFRLAVKNPDLTPMLQEEPRKSNNRPTTPSSAPLPAVRESPMAATTFTSPGLSLCTEVGTLAEGGMTSQVKDRPFKSARPLTKVFWYNCSKVAFLDSSKYLATMSFSFCCKSEAATVAPKMQTTSSRRLRTLMLPVQV